MSEELVERTAAANRQVERTAEQQRAEDARARQAGLDAEREPDMGVGALQAQADAAQAAAQRGEGTAASLVDNAQQDPA